MDGLYWQNPIKMDDLGVPLFSETSIYLCALCLLGGSSHLESIVSNQGDGKSPRPGAKWSPFQMAELLGL